MSNQNKKNIFRHLRGLVLGAPVLFLLSVCLLPAQTLAATAETSLAIDYFNNQSLSGARVTTAATQSAGNVVDLNWGTDTAPAAGMPAQHWSARLAGTVNIDPGTAGVYNVTLGADDGAQLWIDGALISSLWYDHAYTETNAVVGLNPGAHAIKIEYYQNTGGARLKFSWNKTTQTIGTFVGTYFPNRDLSGAGVPAADTTTLNYAWGNISPAAGIPNTNWSGRWIGAVNVDQTGNYLFTAMVDDRIRLYVDDMVTPVMDEWYDQMASHDAVVPLSSGYHILKIEYMQAGGGAELHLSWQKTSQGTDGALNVYGYYYNGMALQGGAIGSRQDGSYGQLNLNFGTSSPLSGLGNTNYSALYYTAFHNAVPETYTFTLGSDDGSTLIIDGQPLIDNWSDHRYGFKSADIMLPPGDHTIYVRYYQNGGGARLSFWWGRRPVAAGASVGQYFNNPTLSGAPAMTRIDPAVDFSWGTGAPSLLIPGDNFSVRWISSTMINTTGNYIFTAMVDDRVRIYVDDMGTPLVDEWQDHRTTVTAVKFLYSGVHTIKIEYMEHIGDAAIHYSYDLSTLGLGTGLSFTGNYFNNMSLSGAPIATRQEGSQGQLDLFFDHISPLAGVNTAHYSAQYLANFTTATANSYVFTLGSADGGRLYVDGNILIDNWNDHLYNYRTTLLYLPAGNHSIRVDYYDNNNTSHIALTWGQNSLPDNTYVAQYFGNENLTGAPLARPSVGLDYGWGQGSPFPQLPVDYFSIRYMGGFTITQAGDYTFTAMVDDRLRLYVDDMSTPLLDEWRPHRGNYSALKTLSAGTHVIKVEFGEDTGDADLHLSWIPGSPIQFSSPLGLGAGEEAGSSLFGVGANQTISVFYVKQSNDYFVSTPGRVVKTKLPVLLTPVNSPDPQVVPMVTINNCPNQNDVNSGGCFGSYTSFRGVVLAKANQANTYLTVINRIKVEDYLKSLGESGQNHDLEYTKANIVAARTYAFYWIQKGGKWSDGGYDLRNNAQDQVYYGYGYEIPASNLTKAVTQTAGQVLTNNNSSEPNHLFQSLYFAYSNGNTYGSNNPGMSPSGVPDPYWYSTVPTYAEADGGCTASATSKVTQRTLNGHGYGYSQRGAECLSLFSQDPTHHPGINNGNALTAFGLLQYYYDPADTLLTYPNYQNATVNVRLYRIGL